jgi:hypothetical protein
VAQSKARDWFITQGLPVFKLNVSYVRAQQESDWRGEEVRNKLVLLHYMPMTELAYKAFKEQVEDAAGSECLFPRLTARAGLHTRASVEGLQSRHSNHESVFAASSKRLTRRFVRAREQVSTLLGTAALHFAGTLRPGSFLSRRELPRAKSTRFRRRRWTRVAWDSAPC